MAGKFTEEENQVEKGKVKGKYVKMAIKGGLVGQKEYMIQ